MRRPILFVLATVLCGCVNQLAQRQALLDRFVGHPDSELVQQLGVPARTYETDGVKYLAYIESRVQIVPGLPINAPGPWWAYGGYGGGWPPQVVNLKCETTFAVAGGVVKSYTLRGNACG
ncbi:MAG TPA: hypothetical protein VK741_09690 [Acetobacteraceae bacterium]|jgi:hypothetical protein|nr:hypothetical protein [Acetobacteraceae bacterium]